MTTEREKLLTEATKITTGDRNVQYGDPNADFKRVAQLVTVYIKEVQAAHELKTPEQVWELQPHDVAVIQILLKISRMVWSPDKYDHWLDIAGYAACGWDCVANKNVVKKQKYLVVTRLETNQEAMHVFFDNGSSATFDKNPRMGGVITTKTAVEEYLSTLSFKTTNAYRDMYAWFEDRAAQLGIPWKT